MDHVDQINDYDVVLTESRRRVSSYMTLNHEEIHDQTIMYLIHDNLNHEEIHIKDHVVFSYMRRH